MNWTEAMAAMLDGKKVRGKYFDYDAWISADKSTSSAFYNYSEFQSMEWEIYKERGEDIKNFNASINRAREAMSNIFEEALEDIEKLKIR